jgi:lysine-arginine-ornithine-binding protein
MSASRLVSVAMAAALAVIVAHGARAQSDDVLRIGVEGAYPPFSWKEPDGSIVGFDIDIALALCAEIGRDCELVEQEWDGMIPALLAGRFDAIVASMSITDERREQVDFSDSYYITPAKFVAPEGSELEPTPEGLAGARIGVQRATTHQCYLEKFFPAAELVLYPTQEEVFQDLAAGRLDVQLSDAIAAQDGFLATDAGTGFAYLGDEQYDRDCHGEGAGIALRQEDDELREAFNAAIRAIRENGVYAEINGRYFAFDVFGRQ